MKRQLRFVGVLSSAIVKHPQTACGIAAAVGTWVGSVLSLLILSDDVSHLRAWLELANGATWPTEWARMLRDHSFRFAVTVGTRTALNFAAPLIAAAGIWFVFAEARRIMNMSRLEQLRLLNAEIVAAMVALVNARHPGVNLGPDDRKEMLDLADEVAEEWLKAAELYDKEHG